MQILCKTTPIQLARHYAMDIREHTQWRPRALRRINKPVAKPVPLTAPVIMDILMATPCGDQKPAAAGHVSKPGVMAHIMHVRQ